MSASGSWPLQVGLKTMIGNIGGVTSVVSGIFDAVPENAACPFVVIGEGEEQDASAFGQVAHDVTPEIQIWDQDGELNASNSGAAGFKRAESVAELIIAALDAGNLSVTGHDVVVLDSRGTVNKSRPDPTDPTLRLVSLNPHILLEDTAS